MSAPQVSGAAFADIVTTLGSFHPLPDDIPRKARTGEPSRALHDACAAEIPALHLIEHGAAPRPATARPSLRIAAWNAERLKFADPSARLLMASGADILLLTETDLGMARSGNRHTTADLAQAAGMGFAFGVEFVELGLGDVRESAAQAGETNSHGLHGNAILSRATLERVTLLRIADGGVWFQGAATADQRRLGARMAMAARLAAPWPALWLVSVHLESRSDAADRADQTRRLLAALDDLTGGEPCVIGGDFNTAAMPAPEAGLCDAMTDPARHEPLFEAMARAGFDWRAANEPLATRRPRWWDPPDEPAPTRIDWLFTRGVDVEAPATLDAVDEAGRDISDHNLVAATIRFR
jgi:endonuclease/exonuclease/phosphatase family metal-dependent hydrolase